MKIKINKKKIILWIFLIFFINFSNNLYWKFYKTKNPNFLEKHTDFWKTQILKINDNTFVKNTYKFSHNVCREWKTQLIKNNSVKNILENTNWGMIPCVFKFEQINKNNIRFYICYEWWAWSWECSYAKMNYNLNSWLWNYQDSWYYIVWQEERIKNLKLSSKEFFRHIKFNFYIFFIENFIHQENFKNFLNYFIENNLLKSQKNIPLIYRNNKFFSK